MVELFDKKIGTIDRSVLDKQFPLEVKKAIAQEFSAIKSSILHKLSFNILVKGDTNP